MSYPTPILNLDFVNSKQLGDKVAFSRSSPATFWDRNGVLRTAVDGMPRFDHDPLTGICKGLLVEPQMPFLETYSEQFDQWAYQSNITRTANSTIAPDGATTADTLNATAAMGYVMQSKTIANSVIYTGSLFFKKTSGATKFPLVYLQFSGGTMMMFGCILNTNTGVFTSIDTTPIAHNVVDCGLYWLVYITAQNNATGNTNGNLYIYDAASTDGITTASPSTNGGAVVWGAKIYAGTGPTSYLPSVASPVTRAADLASVDLTQLKGAAGEALWNGAEGTVVVRWSRQFIPVSDTYPTPVVIDAGSYENRISVFGNSYGEIFTQSAIGGIYTNTSLRTGKTYPLFAAMAYAFKANDHASSFNGDDVVANTSVGLPPNLATMRIGSDVDNCYTHHIRSIQLYNRRIADAYLPALSAL
jgi:hypothetical protein